MALLKTAEVMLREADQEKTQARGRSAAFLPCSPLHSQAAQSPGAATGGVHLELPTNVTAPVRWSPRSHLVWKAGLPPEVDIVDSSLLK